VSTVRTVLDVVNLAAGHLKASGVPGPRLDAEVLLGHVLGLERIQLYVQHDRPLTRQELDAYRSAIARRARREPVAYITGEREFYGRAFAVDRRVLVPRPETEHLVEAALEGLRSAFPRAERFNVADVGTGSGAIAVTLACEDERVWAIATDISEGALEVAKINAERHGVRSRVALRRGDLFSPLAGERFHAVVSNPPYIPEAVYPTLAPEVRVFEPRTALVGGRDGLDVIRALIEGASHHLVPGGFLAMEIGHDQGEAVRRIARARGLENVRILPDLAGRDRVAVIEAPGAGVYQGDRRE